MSYTQKIKNKSSDNQPVVAENSEFSLLSTQRSCSIVIHLPIPNNSIAIVEKSLFLNASMYWGKIQDD